MTWRHRHWTTQTFFSYLADIDDDDDDDSEHSDGEEIVSVGPVPNCTVVTSEAHYTSSRLVICDVCSGGACYRHREGLTNAQAKHARASGGNTGWTCGACRQPIVINEQDDDDDDDDYDDDIDDDDDDIDDDDDDCDDDIDDDCDDVPMIKSSDESVTASRDRLALLMSIRELRSNLTVDKAKIDSECVSGGFLEMNSCRVRPKERMPNNFKVAVEAPAHDVGRTRRASAIMSTTMTHIDTELSRLSGADYVDPSRLRRVQQGKRRERRNDELLNS